MGSPSDRAFEAGAPEFVIDLDAIVNSQRRGVRYNELSSKLARRSSRVVPHPEAGASVLGTINSFSVWGVPHGEERVFPAAPLRCPRASRTMRAPMPPSFETALKKRLLQR